MTDEKSLMPKGLYIHVPFCERKCRYCDFYSVTELSRAKEYVKAVIRNISALDAKFDTVYFGGGTPSLLTAEQIYDVLSSADIREDAEISMECNPNSVSADYLADVHSAGVNRLSFGIQSFCGCELEMLGRLHTAEQAEKAVRLAYGAGFENIGADLMLAVPGQTRQTLLKSLDTAASLPLTHISAYMLKVEDGTPLSLDKELLKKLPDDDETAEMYLLAVRYLEERGFEQYEISNLAKSGFECRHNLKYWRCGEYYGIGPSSHSFVGGERFRCPKQLNSFISAPVQDRIFLGEGGGAEERGMLALRLTKEGLPLADYPESEKPAELLIRNGFLKKEDGAFRLTPNGCLVSNEIIVRLLGGIEQNSAKRG